MQRQSTARKIDALPLPAKALLEWYDQHGRTMAWRIGPAERKAGQNPDPYRVWLSEIMLQQTQVATVHSYFNSFVRRWPNVEALAAAQYNDVMAAWAGLGYYSRARNLKKCAETVMSEHGGRFPQNVETLLALPGIGPYTAAAIAAIAFDVPVAVVDGNVERVMARVGAIATPVRLAKREIHSAVQAWTPDDRPGDFAQAMMDLGATLCTPRNPACAQCPLQPCCKAASAGTQERYPVKIAKPEKPLRRGAAYVAVLGGAKILLRKRPAKGLLGAMTEAPTSDWSSKKDGATGVEAAPFAGDWRHAGIVRHVFTHFKLELTVWRLDLKAAPTQEGRWTPITRLEAEALPTLMKKAIEAALPGVFAAKSKLSRGNLERK